VTGGAVKREAKAPDAGECVPAAPPCYRRRVRPPETTVGGADGYVDGRQREPCPPARVPFTKERQTGKKGR